MAHYAKINNGIVEQVIVAEASFFDTFVDNTPGEWVQTSFTGSIRKQFAGVGYTYDKAKDIFIEEQPYASWTLNATNDWEAPVAYPDDGETYTWDESTTDWIINE